MPCGVVIKDDITKWMLWRWVVRRMLRGDGCDFFCNIFLMLGWCWFVLKVVSTRGGHSVGLSGGHWVVQRWGSGVGV